MCLGANNRGTLPLSAPVLHLLIVAEVPSKICSLFSLLTVSTWLPKPPSNLAYCNRSAFLCPAYTTFRDHQRSVGPLCLSATREWLCRARGGDGQAGPDAGRPHPAGHAGANEPGRGDEAHKGFGRVNNDLRVAACLFVLVVV